MSSPDDAATFSAFVRKKNSVRAVDPGEKGNPAWDAVDPRHSYSAFRRKADSSRVVVNRRSNDVAPGDAGFAQEDEANKGSISTEIGELRGEETMKQVPLQHALTVPETTTIYEACCRMAAGKADALVLTDSNESLSGILTYKDIVKRVIARGIDFMGTPVSKVMTKNPIFVMSDALCVQALEKMVQGEVKQLPVMEHGGVIGLIYLPICLFLANNPERTDENREVILAAAEAIDKRMIHDIN